MPTAASIPAMERRVNEITTFRYFRWATYKYSIPAMVAPKQNSSPCATRARLTLVRTQCGRAPHYLLPYYLHRRRRRFLPSPCDLPETIVDVFRRSWGILTLMTRQTSH